MSGPGVHYLNIRTITDRLGDPTSGVRVGSVDYGDVMERFPSQAALGAQGPDFLFMLPQDLLRATGSGKEGLLKLFRLMMRATHFVEDVNQAIRNAEGLLGMVIEKRAEWEHAKDRSSFIGSIRRVRSGLVDTLGILESVVGSAVTAFALDQIDVFSFMESPSQAQEPPEDWWWFDVLHYRRTGEYAQALIRIAHRMIEEGEAMVAEGTPKSVVHNPPEVVKEGADLIKAGRARLRSGEELLAYALGYLSHYTSDLVGHPYVNMISRGPYRLHGQRHKVIENGHDTWAWATYGGAVRRGNQHTDVIKYFEKTFGTASAQFQFNRMADLEFTSSQLHLEFRPEPGTPTHNGRTSPLEEDVLRRPLQTPKLPSSIARGVHEAIEAVYGNAKGAEGGAYAAAPTPDDVESAFRLWYSWFESSTSNGILPKSLPSHVPLDEALWTSMETLYDKGRAAVETVVGVATDPPDLGELFKGLGGGGGSDLDFDFDAIGNWFKRQAERLIKTLKEIITLIDEVLGAFTQLAASVITTALNVIYKSLYATYYELRKLIVFAGFGFPTQLMLRDGVVRHMIEPHKHADAGRRALSSPQVTGRYPLQAVPKTERELRLLGLDAVALPLPSVRAESHLIYPRAVPEERLPVEGANVGVFDAPVLYASSSPSIYILDNDRFDSAVLDLLTKLASQMAEAEPGGLGRVEQTLGELQSANEQAKLGNVAELTVELARRIGDGSGTEFSLPNLNLDGDRGMGFPCWILSGGGSVNVTPDRVPRRMAPRP